MSQILIIEDEPRIASFVAKGLRAAGYSTHVEATGILGAQFAVSATSTWSFSTWACPTSTVSRCSTGSAARA